jgi:AraC-like DNA-binding protein
MKWGFHVTTVGESRIPPHTPYPLGEHPKGYAFNWANGRTLHDFAIVYLSSGRGWFESKHSPRQRVESGHVFMLFPGVWHRYMPVQKTGWNEHWVGFDGDIPRRLVKNGFFTPKQPVFKINSESLFISLFTDIMETTKNNPPALQQVMSAATHYLLSQLYSMQQATPARAAPVNSAIQEAIHRMNGQNGAELELKKLAHELKVSYTWFRRSFLQHTGLSPHQYHLQLKIARARKLLSDSSLTIQQTAYQAGFESEQYFCRLFKNKTGLTPGQWREQTRNS